MKLLDVWGESFAGILLVIGLIISLVIDAAIVSYVVILLCGIIIGRQYRVQIHKHSAVFYVVTIGFFLGYLLGAFINRRGIILVIIIFFAVGCYLGNYIIKRKLVK